MKRHQPIIYLLQDKVPGKMNSLEARESLMTSDLNETGQVPRGMLV